MRKIMQNLFDKTITRVCIISVRYAISNNKYNTMAARDSSRYIPDTACVLVRPISIKIIIHDAKQVILII